MSSAIGPSTSSLAQTVPLAPQDPLTPTASLELDVDDVARLSQVTSPAPSSRASSSDRRVPGSYGDTQVTLGLLVPRLPTQSPALRPGDLFRENFYPHHVPSRETPIDAKLDEFFQRTLQHTMSAPANLYQVADHS